MANKSDRVILHIDMNAFFAAVEQKTNPALRGKPVLVGGKPNKRTVVAAASYEAKAYGVKSGMSLPEAKRLCPNAIAVEGTPVKYIDTALRIFNLLTAFTPLVEIFSIDEAFMDITDTYHSFGYPEDIAKMIKYNIWKKFGLTCSIGIGPNKLIAKLASGMEKPDGLIIIERKEVDELLKDLPVQELCGIGAKMKRHLSTMGIGTCGDLAKVPVEDLVKRFGVNGIILHKMGRGIDSSPVHPYYEELPVKSMGHSRTLDRNTHNIQVIRANILSLSEMVGRRLRQEHYQGRTICLIMRYSDFDTFSRHLTIDEYVDDGYDIYKSALKILKRIDIDNKAVRLLGVSVTNLRKDAEQLCFLNEHDRNRRLLKALDKINDKYGEFTVMRAGIMLSNPSVAKTPCHGFLHYET